MPTSIKTGVNIHGYHLQADGWEGMVWGDPRAGRLGVIPKGILEALKWDASVIVLGTGASQKDGMLEAEYMYDYALKHLDELSDLTDMSVEDLRAWLESRVHLELTSQNTREEVRAAARFAKGVGVTRLVFVSVPTHSSRSHQAVLSVLGADPELRPFLQNLYTTSSDVLFANATIDDVVVIEPPHRGDTPKVYFNQTAKGIFQFLRNADVAQGFNTAWADLIEEWKKKL